MGQSKVISCEIEKGELNYRDHIAHASLDLGGTFALSLRTSHEIQPVFGHQNRGVALEGITRSDGYPNPRANRLTHHHGHISVTLCVDLTVDFEGIFLLGTEVSIVLVIS